MKKIWILTLACLVWLAACEKENVNVITTRSINFTEEILSYTVKGFNLNDITFNGSDLWIANGDGIIYEDNNLNQSVIKLNPTNTLVTYITGLKVYPIAIICDSNKNVWIANYMDNSVTKINPTGIINTYTGLPTHPIDIISDGTNVWTANNNGVNNISSVTKITPDGKITTYDGVVKNATAIAFNGINIWVASGNNQSVTKISPTGTMITYTGTGGGITDIASDGANILMISGGSIIKITDAGIRTKYNTTSDWPSAITVDNQHQIWTANYSGSITKIDSDGIMTTYSITGIHPTAMAFDSQNNMWIVNYNSNKVNKIVLEH